MDDLRRCAGTFSARLTDAGQRRTRGATLPPNGECAGFQSRDAFHDVRPRWATAIRAASARPWSLFLASSACCGGKQLQRLLSRRFLVLAGQMQPTLPGRSFDQDHRDRAQRDHRFDGADGAAVREST